MADKTEKQHDLGVLEEDDEFEEFPAEDWKAVNEDDKGDQVWEENWEDDNIEDDFSIQLRAELEKKGSGSSNTLLYRYRLAGFFYTGDR